MNNRQFDPLDDRFRQAAEQFDPPYDPDDWANMEKLLDGKKDKKRPFAFWWITDVMMMTMLFLFIFQGNKEKTPAPVANGASLQADYPPFAKTSPMVADKLPNEPAKKGTELNGGNEKPVSASKNANFSSQYLNKRGIANKMAFQAAGTKNSTQGKKYNLKPQGEPITEAAFLEGDQNKTDRGNKKNQTVSMMDGQKNATDIGISANKQSEVTDQQQDNNQRIAQTTASGQVTGVDSMKFPADSGALSVQKNDSFSTGPEKKTASIPSRKGMFFISATYGLEKSGVKGGSLGPSGSIYGVMAGYQFHRDWSVKLGFFITDKNYSGGSGIYKVPPGSYYREITDFRALCGITEIPLLVSYRFLHGKKSNWLVSAGPVTSIMKSEEYHYHYTNSSGGTSYGKKYYNTNAVDWFSGFRISPSYQRFFGKWLSLSADPFIQLPITGVGEGSVKLHSLGFQITTSIHLDPFAKK